MINMTEYAARRKTLMQQVGAKGIVILPAAKELPRNGDAVYAYRQNSDFYYLTGFDEPEAVLVLLPGRKEGEFILFNRIRDRDKEIWDGPRAGQDGAKKDFLADESYPIEQFSTKLRELLVGREAIHYPLGINQSFDKKLMTALNQLRANIRNGEQIPTAFFDITPSIHEMRLHKSDAEVEVMRKAAEISARAHIRAMKACKPGMYEYELEAELLYDFVKQGARTPAYNSIVGAGAHSCILHYVSNNSEIHDGDMVLIDAGAEYQCYAADITRTFPANGKFSAEQRAIYEIVLASQLAAIQTLKPGVLWTAPQEAIVKVITQGLVDVGILKGNVVDLIETKAYLPFYMHKSGHWLGLDVHDAGRYRVNGEWRTLSKGMTLTVEPGIYISADIQGVDKRWHNIGIRIEDDVVITDSGVDVLTKDLPKTIADIEALMAE